MVRQRTATELSMIAVVATVPLVFFASLPWLAGLADWAVLLATAVAATLVMGAAGLLSARADRRRDGVQRAGSRFSSHWALMIGGPVAVLLSLLPPIQGLLADLARGGGVGPGETEGATLVFTAGILTVVLAQGLVCGVSGRVWRRRMTTAQ